jgi:DNA-binding CsgD family transcriptional regulator
MFTPAFFVFSDEAFSSTANSATGNHAAASRAVCNRFENGQIIFYATLYDAFEACSGISIDEPDEIILLADMILESPIIIPDGKHIRLVSDSERTIARGKSLIDYPLFWIEGNDASFSLGNDDMKGSITLDGAYLNDPSIEAKAPLISVNGLDSTCVMYDKITLQNNYNIADTDGSILYQYGAGVLVRTYEYDQESPAEFIMKGGVIQSNINNSQNVRPFGGGVLILTGGAFTMEGGIIMNNSASRIGGGVCIDGDLASFKKTGGIIYGEDAPEAYRNIAIKGMGNPKHYGHAISSWSDDNRSAQYRNNTVGEDDHLSYIDSPTGNAVFGKGDHWDNPSKEIRKRLTIIILSVILLAAALLFASKKIRYQMQKIFVKTQDEDLNGLFHGDLVSQFTPREKEVFILLLSDMSIKEIAAALHVSYSSAYFHSQNIYKKLDVKNQTELLIHYLKSK